jgi:hypothetical protein
MALAKRKEAFVAHGKKRQWNKDAGTDIADDGVSAS